MKCQKKNEQYTCIACITINSVMKVEKKHLQVYLETYLQVYLEECKYKIKKKKLTNVIKAEL